MRAAAAETVRPDVAVYRFNAVAAVLLPLGAIFAQAFLPTRFPLIAAIDLPLLMTIFFALGRRNPIAGLLTGAAIGLMQDSLSPLPVGIYGIANTIVGYGASSLGGKIDTDSRGSRGLITFGFCLLHQAVFFFVARQLVRLDLEWYWRRVLLIAVANALVAIVLFAFLDRFKHRL